MSINPRDMTVKDWCDQNVPLLVRYGQVPFIQDPARWQDWGVSVIKNPGVAAFNPPDPRFFTNFYEWAERFNSVVPL